jgi:hypothetical protein
MTFDSFDPVSFHLDQRASVSTVFIRQVSSVNELEQRLGPGSVKVNHVEVFSSHERLDQVDDLVDDWTAVRDVNVPNSNWMGLLSVFQIESHR